MQRSKLIHWLFCVLIAITDKSLVFILDLEKVQISISKQYQFLQLFLDLFGSPDQVTNKLLIPILTCQWNGSEYIQKYITSFQPFCVPNITNNKLSILLSEILKATWCKWRQFYYLFRGLFQQTLNKFREAYHISSHVKSSCINWAC